MITSVYFIVQIRECKCFPRGHCHKTTCPVSSHSSILSHKWPSLLHPIIKLTPPLTPALQHFPNWHRMPGFGGHMVVTWWSHAPIPRSHGLSTPNGQRGFSVHVWGGRWCNNRHHASPIILFKIISQNTICCRNPWDYLGCVCWKGQIGEKRATAERKYWRCRITYWNIRLFRFSSNDLRAKLVSKFFWLQLCVMYSDVLWPNVVRV